MNEIMTIMVGNENEIGEVESINGFFYTVAFAERIEVIDIRKVQYKVLQGWLTNTLLSYIL